MNIKEVKKYLNKKYLKDGQMLYIAPECIWDDKRIFVDVWTSDIFGEIDRYLFTIVTYDAYEDLDLVYESLFNRDKCVSIYKFDDVKASCAPLYIDRTFTLKKFGYITPKDVIGCLNYYIKKVLGEYWIWNKVLVMTNEKRGKEVKSYYPKYKSMKFTLKRVKKEHDKKERELKKKKTIKKLRQLRIKHKLKRIKKGFYIIWKKIKIKFQKAITAIKN